MKKIYSVLACAVLTLGVNAQNLQDHPTGARVPNNPARTAPPATQSSMSFYTDYDYMDEAYAVDSSGILYSRYIWDMNMNYSLPLGDTSITYAIVDFSAFWDSYNAAGPVVVPTSTFNSYTIDSVFILGGHSNHDGFDDTIIVNIIGLNSQSYPQIANVLHRDTLIAAQFGTQNQFLQAAVIGVEVNYTITNPATRYAVQVEYYGNRTLDTFGILAGFEDLGPGNCPSLPQLQNFAIQSHHYRNSYRYEQRYSPAYGILPNASNQDTYYDCNGNAPTHDVGVDSENFLQNWGIWSRITINGVGINETANTGISLEQNMPNPADNSTTINYSLANGGSNVLLEVYDVTGQLVETVDQGQQIAGAHQVELNTANYAAGVYFYTLNVDGVKVTKRMVIAE